MSQISITAKSELSTEILPGDRFNAEVDESRSHLMLPATANMLFESVSQVEDVDGGRHDVTYNAATQQLSFPKLSELLPEQWDSVALEYKGPRRWQFRVQTSLNRRDTRALKTDQGVVIKLNSDDWAILRGSSRRCADLAEFQLALRAAELSTHGGFEQLICLPLVRDMELLDHQIRTAKTVLRRFRGRALLCDEVGLGKTIEAGLVMSELQLRGLIQSALILTPPSLVEQWQAEMRRKFALDCVAFDAPEFREAGKRAWRQFDRIIVSIHTAKREPHRKAILARKWGLVIVDEAHHLRNRNTQTWKFVNELKRQYSLLLTATPVQTNLDELFSLVTLLEPGLLNTAKQFQQQFVNRKDKRAPNNVEALHSLLDEVMVRSRRSTVGLSFTRRQARTDVVTLTTEERQVYDLVSQFVRDRLVKKKQSAGLNRLSLLNLQMAVESSVEAAAGILDRLSQHSDLITADRNALTQMAELARGQQSSAKIECLLKLLDDFSDKVVIFTQFRATLDMLRHRLSKAGHDLAVFHGSLPRMQKESVIERFRGDSRILLCTQSGSEGRNLQFARGVCNFDLPWNPTQIEQRIGRLSRIGQKHDVSVFNVVADKTVEAEVLRLLDVKLGMFELVIGEIDLIMSNLDEDKEFQYVVADRWIAAKNVGEFRQSMEELADRLLTAKEEYVEQRRRDDQLFGNKFMPDAA